MSYRPITSSSTSLNVTTIRSNHFFLTDGFSRETWFPSPFHIKVKKTIDNSEGWGITKGSSGRICCITTDEHGGRAREGESFFHSFPRRNFALSHPLCTPCGHCRSSVTRSRDRRRFLKLPKCTHDLKGSTILYL